MPRTRAWVVVSRSTANAFSALCSAGVSRVVSILVRSASKAVEAFDALLGVALAVTVGVASAAVVVFLTPPAVAASGG